MNFSAFSSHHLRVLRRALVSHDSPADEIVTLRMIRAIDAEREHRADHFQIERNSREYA